MGGNLIVLAFDGRHEAEGLLGDLEKLQEAGQITIEDAVVASRGEGAEIHIEQTHSKTGKTAVKGTGIGLLAGLLLGGPIIGLAGGAAIGAIVGKMKDYGVDDKFIEEVSRGLKANSSALFLLVKDADAEQIEKLLKPVKATVLSTTLSEEQEEKLKKALEKEEF